MHNEEERDTSAQDIFNKRVGGGVWSTSEYDEEMGEGERFKDAWRGS